LVAGGTAGSVIANRLTEDPRFTVLLIEAGPNNEGVLNIEVPAFSGRLTNSPYDWNLTTVSQVGLNGRSLPYPRGHVLGGSSSINGMVFTRGSSDDYDRWARVTGDNGWSWNALRPYLLKNEHWVPPVDGHNTTGEFDPRAHGFDGVNYVSLGSYLGSIDERVIQTTVDLKNEFPCNLDTNDGTPLGVGFMQSTIGFGERSSAARSYLASNFRQRANLHILTDTTVTQILSTGLGVRPDFRIVELASSKSAKSTLELVRSEQMLCKVGCEGSTKVLLWRGLLGSACITSRKYPILSTVETTSESPAYHPMPPSTRDSATELTSGFSTNWTMETVQSKQIPHHGIPRQQTAWWRAPSNTPGFKDSSAGPKSPHTEIALGVMVLVFPLSSKLHTVSIRLTYYSLMWYLRGRVTLKTNSPFDAPLIDVLVLREDHHFVTEGIKATKRFFSGPAWKDLIIGETSPGVNVTNDDELTEYIRNSAGTALHAVGTAAMSARGASHGVVDLDLRVKGISGLRIVDASIMPFVISGNTQAGVYLIAERGADLIKSAWV
ncbi:GMC oxidoreductase, partial [Sphaerobolus stellatus SS14]